MRTVFVGAQEKPNGINSYTYNLAKELTNRGFSSFIMGWGTCNKVIEYEGIKIIQYKTYGGTMTSLPMLYWRTIPYIIKHRQEIDVVMYQSTEFSVLPSFIVRMFGMKTCAVIHSLAEDSPKHNKFMKLILMTFMKLSLIFTKHAITISHAKAKEIYNRYRKKCAIIPCGVNLPIKENTTSDFLKKHSILSGKYFLSIGRIDPIKNLDILVEAFKNHKHGEYQLIICGDVSNPYGRKIVKLAQECDRIIFPGIVSGDVKDSLLRHCAAYCLISSSEGLPIALLEGLSYAKPVIVSQIPAIQEVLAESEIGLWCDVNNVEMVVDCMRRIETEYEEIKSEGEIAYKIIKNNYTWKKVCDIYLNHMN